MKPILAKELMKGPKAAVGNSGDAEQVKAAERKDESRAERDRRDLMFLMEQPEFARWLWNLFDRCGYERVSMGPDPHKSYFNDGQRSVAIGILGDLDQVDPGFYGRMREEARTEEIHGR